MANYLIVGPPSRITNLQNCSEKFSPAKMVRFQEITAIAVNDAVQRKKN